VEFKQNDRSNSGQLRGSEALKSAIYKGLYFSNKGENPASVPFAVARYSGMPQTSLFCLLKI
jgi:hypothetical protein